MTTIPTPLPKSIAFVVGLFGWCQIYERMASVLHGNLLMS